MRVIELKPNGNGIVDTLYVVDDLLRGINGGYFLVTELGKLVPLFSAAEQYKFPAPTPDGRRGATIVWALMGLNLHGMPMIQLYEQPEHEIDPLI